MITAVYSYMLEKNPILYQVSAYLVSYCLLLRQQRFEHPTLQQTSVLRGCIQNSTISSNRVRCCTNKHTNRGHNLHGRVVKKIRWTLKWQHKTAAPTSATPICTTVVQIKRARLESASRTTHPETHLWNSCVCCSRTRCCALCFCLLYTSPSPRD